MLSGNWVVTSSGITHILPLITPQRTLRGSGYSLSLSVLVAAERYTAGNSPASETAADILPDENTFLAIGNFELFLE